MPSDLTAKKTLNSRIKLWTLFIGFKLYVICHDPGQINILDLEVGARNFSTFSFLQYRGFEIKIINFTL